MNKSELLKSKQFCILPFIHTCIWTTGEVIPCCINHSYDYGNIKNQSLDEIFTHTNPKLKQLRHEMITGDQLPVSCIKCTQAEQYDKNQSLRIFSNNTYGHLLNNLEFDTDNNLINEQISLWDVRFSNLCNLKCRMCDDVNSSSIAEENWSKKKTNIPVLRKAYNDLDNFLTFFVKHINTIEEIYFCGGEPLMLAEHYKILDLLIEHNKLDILIRYNSNCTIFDFKDKNVITDYWPLFKNVKLAASIDAGWEQLYYIRHGAEWDDVFKNLQLITEKCPHVVINLNPTVEILSLFHIKEMHEVLIKANIVKPDNVHYNLLTYPSHYGITVLPKEFKTKAEAYINQYAITMKEFGACEFTLNKIHTIITHMYSVDNQKYLSKFKQDIEEKDQFRNENFLEVFPEYKELFN